MITGHIEKLWGGGIFSGVTGAIYKKINFVFWNYYSEVV
ncbi:hypothetical protein MNBD_BACTEROID01-873 [hydrothermal vent metagenome]|uniref:Uncharacterized protein n=1 Tax=hydrothermal vent metagenome TaxID=652676 RepID=A0A3B0TR41_9ZZZZ